MQRPFKKPLLCPHLHDRTSQGHGHDIRLEEHDRMFFLDRDWSRKYCERSHTLKKALCISRWATCTHAHSLSESVRGPYNVVCFSQVIFLSSRSSVSLLWIKKVPHFWPTFLGSLTPRGLWRRPPCLLPGGHPRAGPSRARKCPEWVSPA